MGSANAKKGRRIMNEQYDDDSEVINEYNLEDGSASRGYEDDEENETNPNKQTLIDGD